MSPARDEQIRLSFVLNRDHTIREVLSDEHGLIPEKGTLDTVFLGPSKEKARALIRAADEGGAAHDWELAVTHGEAPLTLRFTASRVNEFYCVTASAETSEQAGLEALVEIQNELGTLQRDLALRNAQLLRSNRDKNELLGAVAHDLRSPLGLVTGYGNLLLKDEPRLTDEQRVFVERMVRGGDQMVRLVDSLVDLSAVESGIVRLDREQVDLRDLLEEAASAQEELRAKPKQIRITCSVPSEPLEVHADAGKLRQVLDNLLDNAVKYSEPRTTVRLEAGQEEDHVWVRVRDSGHGISPEDLTTIFRPFRRASQTGHVKGTGLGLAIAKKLIESHGGKIEAVSTLGEGSVFKLTLPRGG